MTTLAAMKTHNAGFAAPLNLFEFVAHTALNRVWDTDSNR
jgi:hypothetical protein